jgi:hypothetical protein
VAAGRGHTGTPGSEECLLLTGTIVTATGQFETQAWRYLGGSWRQMATDFNEMLAGKSAFDARRQRLVFNQGTVIAELSLTPAAVVSTGSPCGTPAPRLSARARPRLGDPSFGLDLRAFSGQAALFGVADALGSLPLPNGCVLLLAGTVTTVVTPVLFGGTAEVVIPIPPSPVLRGLALYAQAAVLDGGTAGAFRMTQALRLVVGD